MHLIGASCLQLLFFIGLNLLMEQRHTRTHNSPLSHHCKGSIRLFVLLTVHSRRQKWVNSSNRNNGKTAENEKNVQSGWEYIVRLSSISLISQSFMVSWALARPAAKVSHLNRSSIIKTVSSFTVWKASVRNGPFTDLPYSGFYWPLRFLLSSNISAGPHCPATNPLPVLPVNVQQKDLCDWWKMSGTDFCPREASKYFSPFSVLRWKWVGGGRVGLWQRQISANYYMIGDCCNYYSTRVFLT